MKKLLGKHFFYLIIPFLFFVACNNADVNSLEINSSEEYLAIGDTLKLAYKKIEPENKDYEVNWSSTNPEVASVDGKGLVIAKSEGQTLISASCRKESAICEINVVSHRFKNAAIFRYGEPNHFHLVLSNATEQTENKENKSDILLIFDLMLPQDSVNIVKGTYIAGDETSDVPYFISGKRGRKKGSYLIERATNDTTFISGGDFSVSTPEKLYFILGNLETEQGNNISFVYEGGIPAKNIPTEETDEKETDENPEEETTI